MVKSIDTLVTDIESLLEKGFSTVPEELCDNYGKQFADLLRTRFIREPKVGLRMSNAGKPCERQLHYEINSPEDGEKFRAETYAKFLYGDLIELLMLFMAEASGHEVTGTQDTQDIAGIKGHRDAVIDGVLVDVKSASPYSFKKFRDGELEGNDSFGYIDQLQSYLYAAQDDDKVTDKGRAAFFVMDKVGGHICLDFHERNNKDYDQFFREKIKMVDGPIPARGFDPVPEGKSGNMKLGVNCSYCAFKDKCWPSSRTFLYYNGPVTLVEVKSEPRVPELTTTSR